MATDRRSRLHVMHAGGLWAGHACAAVRGEGTAMDVAAALGPGACLRVTV